MSRQLANPITGERLMVKRAAKETDGQLLEIEAWLPGGWREPWRHAHPHQEERVEVVAGTLLAEIDGRSRAYRDGESLIVPPGLPHLLAAPGPGRTQLLVQERPALRSEEFLRIMHRLAVEGRLDPDGRPKAFAWAAAAHEFESEVRLIRPPLRLSRLLMALLAPIARRWCGVDIHAR